MEKQAAMSELFLKVHDRLPIFKIDFGEYIVLYTIGYALKIKAIPVQELIDALKSPDEIVDQSTRNSIMFILKNAQEAINNWNLLTETPFSPECLTIHVGHECNLNCTYCYSKVKITGNKNVVGFPELDAINALIDYIAEKRMTNSKRLTVVFHGSGEPTFHWQKLVDSYKSIFIRANQKGLEVLFYIATNGCITEPQIDWLAKNLDLIGISCDGPDTIQQKHRFSRNLKYLPIDKVCQRVKNKGGKFDIRVTVTRDSILLLPEIITYLINACKATNIRIEPVYLVSDNKFTEEDADIFFRRFIEAQKNARKFGVAIDYSGMRINELHGSYCDAMRNTIRLTSEGITRNCFCFMTYREELITGRFSLEGFDFHLSPKIDELRKRAFEIPDECSDCINIFHCSRGCPEFCIYEKNQLGNRKLNPFRCRLHQLLAVEKIKESVTNSVL